MHRRSWFLHVRVGSADCLRNCKFASQAHGCVILVTGDTLELAVFLSVKLQDEAAFERNYQQLQMYVLDPR